MPISSNVTIKMKGLGVAHQRKTDQMWEFLFLNGIAKHELTITVIKRDAAGNIIFAKPLPNVLGAQKIEIVTNDPPSPGIMETGGPFSHDASVDPPRDARWIVDLSELYGSLQVPSAVIVEKLGVGKQHTYLNINNARLFTSILSRDFYKFTIPRPPNPIPEVKSRKVALWLGTEVVWGSTSSFTEIKIDNVSIIRLAPESPSVQFEIIVDNDCFGRNLLEQMTCDRIDFEKYYQEIINYDLQKVIVQTGPFDEYGNPKSLMSGRIDCHLIQISSATDKHGKPVVSLETFV